MAYTGRPVGGIQSGRTSRRVSRGKPARDMNVETRIVSKEGGKEIVQEVMAPTLASLYQDIEVTFGEDDKWEVGKKGGFRLDHDTNMDMLTHNRTIISNEEYSNDWDTLTIASGKVCLQKISAEKILNSSSGGSGFEIRELESTIPITTNDMPKIDFMQIRNADCLNQDNFDMMRSNPPNCFNTKGYSILIII